MTFQIQAEFDFEPPRSRLSDIETAVQAGAIPIHRLSAHRALVLKALYEAGERGATDFETSAATGLIATSAGKRRLDLMLIGLVERFVTDDGPVTRPSPTLTPSAVWRITAKGIAYYQEHT